MLYSRIYPFLAIFIALSLPLLSQDFDESFLESLPDGIAEDIKRESADKTVEELNIPTPETRITNLEQALSDAKRSLARIEQDLNQENLSVNAPLQKFGKRFFSSFQSTFLPINEPNANSEYILDSGDILTLQLVGQINETYNRKILRNGAINIPEVGDINLAGLSISEATEITKNLISNTFIGVDTYLSLAELRDMNVMIVGNVPNPGMYTLGGGSSALALIRAAGGIDDVGSYRNIIHKRDGQILHDIDLYSIFIDGDISKLSQLRSGDAVIVKPSLLEVQISGGVANPAIYELRPNEKLSNLLEYSGYYKNQDTQLMHLSRRNLKGEYVKLELNFLEDYDFSLLNGDSIDIPFVRPKFQETRKIVLSGEVEIPGTYFVNEGTKLSDLIELAGGYTDQAYPLGGVFKRESAVKVEKSLKDRSYNELVRFLISTLSGLSAISSDSLLTFLALLKEYEPSGRIVTEFSLSELKLSPSKDRFLNGGDKIHIPAFVNQVYVYGEVLNPSAYDYDPNLNFSGYLELSGGFSRSADENKIILISPNGVATSISIGLFSSLAKNSQILPGSTIYVPQFIGKIDGISLASAVAPIVSSFALSIASLNSINN